MTKDVGKVWKGEKVEMIIETNMNLARKELIRENLSFYGIAFKEQINDRGTKFITKNFVIEYDYNHNLCRMDAYEKQIFREFLANTISEMFDFMIEKKIIIYSETIQVFGF